MLRITYNTFLSLMQISLFSFCVFHDAALYDESSYIDHADAERHEVSGFLLAIFLLLRLSKSSRSLRHTSL